LYSKDFTNIADNFQKLNEGQNKIFASLNSHDNELNRLKNDMGGNVDQMKKMEDFFNNNSKLNSLVEEANKLWTFF